MNAGQHILIFLARVYQWTLSPAKMVLFGPLGRCRYTPSCSIYAQEAVRVHGVFSGSSLALKRICRCHPWGGCEHDPVPVENRRYSRMKSCATTEVASELKTQNLKLKTALHGS